MTGHPLAKVNDGIGIALAGIHEVVAIPKDLEGGITLDVESVAQLLLFGAVDLAEGHFAG